MDDSALCADVATEGIVVKSYSYSLIFVESCIENKRDACSTADDTAMPLKGVNVPSISDKDDSTVQALGVALSEVLNVHDTREGLVGSNPGLDQGVIYSQKEYMQSLSLDKKMEKGLSSSGTTPSSEDGSSRSLLSINGKEDLPTMLLHNESFAEDQSPVYAHSATLPVTIKLVSAMKGGRDRQGMPLKAKLHVKWAPEVYDPPVTSSSHTVKGHHHRSKVKKKDLYKYKHNKGRSSRGNNSERKHTTRRSTCNITDPWTLSFHGRGGRLPLNGFDQSEVEILEYGAVGHELKCSSSYYTDPLASLHLPIAEAS